MEKQLDNPIWSALTSCQSGVSQGDALARRFLEDIGPLAGMAFQSQESYEALAALAKPDEPLVLFLSEPPDLPPGWRLDRAGMLTQMVLERNMPVSSVSIDAEIKILTEADIPEMLALTELTKPGPFRQRTIELGMYVGVCQAGKIVAMVGERLHMADYTEVSAVCTHPDFQGRGYAKALMRVVADNIRKRGDTPFLHAFVDNYNAIEVYKKLGYRERRQLHLAVVQFSAAHEASKTLEAVGDK